MIDLTKTLDIKHVAKIVGKDSNKQAIFEKFVYSMILLEQLDYLLKDKAYLFKGGTSLLLHFSDSSRFSIDVDISMPECEYENKDLLCEHFKENLPEHFSDVIKDNERTNGGRNIKCAHYFFYYQPIYQTNEPYVLLDVIYQDVAVKKKRIYVDNKNLMQDGDRSMIDIIDIDSLLGDKLTAFAPNTIGVRYTAKNQFGRPKSCEIIKQLYDCAYLYNKYVSIDDVLVTYKSICQYQIKHSKDKFLTLNSCLLDTYHTCELILNNGRNDKIHYSMLLDGLTSFNFYKIGENIDDIDLKSYALKVATLIGKFIRLTNKAIKKVNKVDYLIKTGISEQELKLISTKEELNEFFDNCV